jgi:hypothetical protein
MIKAVQSTVFVILIGGACLLTIAWAQTPEAAKGPANDSGARTKHAVRVSDDAQPVPAQPPEARPRAVPAEPGMPAPPSGFSFGGEGGGEWGVSGAGHPFLMNRHARHGRFGGPLMSEEEIQEHQALEQAVGSLKSAKSDAEKTNATNEISKILEKWFKRDLERREKQIAEIEARVKKLQEQIAKRKKAKDEIINLQVKTIVNEAEGLGFPGSFGHESDVNPPARHMRTPGPSFSEWSETPLAIPRSGSPPAETPQIP